uniref:Uncharacterized protein n=1 Tax=Ascaris lumbricoides TaxID=6252 RepID=A0A0M3IFW2_ASCLU
MHRHDIGHSHQLATAFHPTSDHLKELAHSHGQLHCWVHSTDRPYHLPHWEVDLIHQTLKDLRRYL